MNYNDVQILLVEDNIHDAELAIRALKKENLSGKLLHVQDGAEALDFVFARGSFALRNKKIQPRLILLDIKMPRIDGIEVLRLLKINTATKTIPVVMMTSSNQEQDLNTCYQLGANSYVVKPVSFDAFSKTVTKLGLYWLSINQPI